MSNGGGNTYNLFTTTPQLEADLDSVSVNLGTEFYVTAQAWVTRHWQLNYEEEWVN